MIIAQLINFAILFFVFQKFMSKPFLHFLKEEKRKEEEKNQMLGKLNAETEKYAQKEKEMAVKQKKEMEAVIKEAKAEAVKLKDEMMAKAQKEAKDILDKTKLQLDEERQQMIREIKEKVADVSTLMVGKALQNYLSDDDQKKITQNILSNLPESSKLE